tara:strand:+ start:457 stop:645 length:189 start_codon:yes stop_codon:yes gene_type:complete
MEPDLIQLEIEQIRNQIELLDAMFDEYLNQEKKQVSICEKLSNNYYYESLLHKLGWCKGKEE